MPSAFPPASDLVALDIGGANIKAADGLGWTKTAPFAMWREWQRLAEMLAAFIGSPVPRRVVATMTGEIADCFPSRRIGVAHIVSSLITAVGNGDAAADTGIYSVDGRIVSPQEALAEPQDVAASNWHAVARLAASIAPTDRTLLIDIGSTTVDVIPIRDGRPAPLACDDAGRMASGELVYTGMERTPLPAMVRWLPHRGVHRPVASERFADSRDVWLLLGGVAEDPAWTDTADGRPATRDAARVRLARTLLLEPSDFSVADAHAAAEWCAEAQARQVARALDRVARRAGWRPTGLVISGHGTPLANQTIARLGWNVNSISLVDSLAADVSRVAPAHALALIARGVIG